MSDRRIMIIGYSGSGKSTLARKLGEKWGCEVMHLDCVHWLPGWKERKREEKADIINSFLDAHYSWVIDGNYTKDCYERRLREATQIIFFKFPRRVCLFRALKRYFQYRGKSRESMTKGCEEKIDREFVWWILWKGRNRAHKRNYKAVCEGCAEKVVILKSPGAVRRFLQNGL